MSLLMQALKRAEQTKQKLEGKLPASVAIDPASTSPPKAPEEVLTLSPKEPEREPEPPAAIGADRYRVDHAEERINPFAIKPPVENPTVSPTPTEQNAGELLKNEESILPLVELPPTPNAVQGESDLSSNIQGAAPVTEYALPLPKTATVNTTATTATTSTPTVDTPISAAPSSGDIATARITRQKISEEQQRAAALAASDLHIEQQKAKTVFDSKSATPSSKANVIARRRVLSIAGLGVLLLAIGAGYFYLQLNSGSTSIVPPATNATVAPTIASTATVITPEITAASAARASLPTTSDAQVVNTESVVAGSIGSATKPATVSDARSLALAKAAPMGGVPDGKSPTTERPQAGTTVAGQPVQSPQKLPRLVVADTQVSAIGIGRRSSNMTTSSVRVRADNKLGLDNASAVDNDESRAIQIRQSSRGNVVNPNVSSAYQLYTTGDLNAAAQAYSMVLQKEPNNRDALLGLAAIALSQRQAEQAGSYYGKLLEADPNDPEAIAGLTSLQQGDPVQSESRLKKALSQHPQASALLFALGNLYAQQSRWGDAQQAYFRAYATAPANADYAFNLAVSLDRLSQAKLAREYYQRALSLGVTGAINFSRDGVQNRIVELGTAAQ